MLIFSISCDYFFNKNKSASLKFDCIHRSIIRVALKKKTGLILYKDRKKNLIQTSK
jgi:hypothetical protein